MELKESRPVNNYAIGDMFALENNMVWEIVDIDENENEALNYPVTAKIIYGDIPNNGDFRLEYDEEFNADVEYFTEELNSYYEKNCSEIERFYRTRFKKLITPEEFPEYFL